MLLHKQRYFKTLLNFLNSSENLIFYFSLFKTKKKQKTTTTTIKDLLEQNFINQENILFKLQ